MDALVSAALHEIAVEGTQGCSLPKLWAGLQAASAALEIDLTGRGKQILWQQVLHVPGITFLLAKSPGSQSLEAHHPSVQSVEEAENLGVYVVAPEGLRESCLGLYDGKLCDAAISRDQRELLERLAKARSQGVTQSQLGKDFKTGGNKMFYVVRSLEARGLVVRHATIVRTHQSGTKGAFNKFVPIVATNLVHLTRYAKDQNLGSHMRYEIPSSSKSNLSNSSTGVPGDGAAGEEDPSQATEEVLINDDYPAMARICEKLEAADDKVLVVSDLKLGLNYRFAQGHRSWRRLAKRLQDAGIVEIFNAQIAGSKIVPCIRLLKSFNAKAFQPGNDDTETETQLRGVKRGQVTDQVVESTLDRQIYDLIDNSGPAGLYMMDIWKQLGLNNKRNYFRITNMLSKGCIVSEAEQHKKSMLYRLRTASNATLASNGRSSEAPAIFDQELQSVVPLAQIAPPPAARISRKRKAVEKEKEKQKEIEEEPVISQSISDQVPRLLDSNESRAVVVFDLSSVKVDEGESIPGRSTQSPYRSGQLYACPLQTTTAIQRELRIMQRLQEEKFIPRVELHRWIEDSEKDHKDTMMDRKTLTRLLQKLQREGRVKSIILSMPGLTNCGRSRTSEVVLLPDVVVGPELLARVHDRIRQFDMNNRGYGSSKVKADASTVPVLMGVRQIHKGGKRKPLSVVESEAEKVRSLSENGFVPAKMVRVRMLHSFLWSYVNGISEYADEDLVMKADNRSCRVFSLALAMKAMPLELFLQVVGSTKSIEELAPYCHKELRLCDLPEAESSSLLSSHANSRLSWLIDVLRRLKLIRLVMGTGIPLGRSKANFSQTSTYSLEAALIYAMEIQPYIEEPAPQPLSSLSLDAFDLTPRARHEFTMTSDESLEAYWQTLEYFYSGAMPTIARRAFPGSNVPELFGLRSWTSLRLMTLEQRRELMKRVEEGGEEKKMTALECAALARELDLSLEQVLRVSYEKNRRYRLQVLEKENLNSSAGASDKEVTVSKGHRIKPNIVSGSKKRAGTDVNIMEPAHVKAYKRQRQLEQGAASLDQPEPSGLPKALVNLDGEEDNHEVNDEEGEEEEEEDKGTEDDPINYLKAATKLKPVRCKRFPWSEDLDRILICCYSRQRAILGARNHRVEWASIPSLPANPAACRRRIAQLKSEPSVRKSLMSLCSLLAARFLKQEEDTMIKRGKKPKPRPYMSQALKPLSTNKDGDSSRSQPEPASVSQALIQLPTNEDADSSNRHLVLASESEASIPLSTNDSTDSRDGHLESVSENAGQELAWDSFDNISVAAALNEVIQLRNIAKALSSKRTAAFRTNVARMSQQQTLEEGNENPENSVSTSLSCMMEGSNDSILPITSIDPLALSTAAGYLQGAELLGGPETVRSGALLSCCAMTSTRGRPKSVRVRKRKKASKPVLTDEMSSEEVVQTTLGVANAVELVKMVLLNASVAEIPSPVVDALRRCEESHVFAAFNYLRDQGFVIAGPNSIPYVLSPKFFHDAAASRFPFGTGNEALTTTQWLAANDCALDEGWIPFPTDNFCGQLVQLLGVVSEGTVTIAPFLPEEGIGESEDNKNVVVGVKRKTEGGQEIQFMRPKIQRPDTSSPGFRRERGFPGVKVCIHRATKPVGELLLATISKGPHVSEAHLANQESTSISVDLETIQNDGVTEPDSQHTTICFQAMDGKDDMGLNLSDCLHHFCPVSGETSNGGENEGLNLSPLLLEAATRAIEEAGKEGLSSSQLTNHLTSNGHDVNEELVEASIDALGSFDLVKQVNAFDHVRFIAGVHSGPFFLQIGTKRLDMGVGERALSDHDPSRTNHQGPSLVGEGSGGLGELLGQSPSIIATLTSLATGTRNWGGLHSQNQPQLLGDSSGHRRVLITPGIDKDTEVTQTVPILPWFNEDGGINSMMLKALSRRVMGIVMLNPGINEDDLVGQLDVLNPQTARELLHLLDLDGHLKVRKLLLPNLPTPPQLLSRLIKPEVPETAKPKFRRHYYANGTSGSLL